MALDLVSRSTSCCRCPLNLSQAYVLDSQLSRMCVRLPRKDCFRAGRVEAVMLEPPASDNAGDSVSNFVKRTERAWLISKVRFKKTEKRGTLDGPDLVLEKGAHDKQPRPTKCASCEASGSNECQWCKGTGFFILGDQMLCEVPSRNTTCVICFGQGTVPCEDCKGTGFRALWLGPPQKKEGSGDDSPRP